jgi:hypothetical protein
MDNPETLATYGAQNEDKQNKNTTQYVLDTSIRKQTQITFTFQFHKSDPCILKTS